jgi:NAD+ synthase
MINLSLNNALVEKFIEEFIFEETQSNGFQKAVIGLSGGVDSALVTYLSVKALGKENVKVFLMPYKTSSPTSVEDAMLVINDLEIPYEVINITEVADTYFKKQKEINNLRKGNFLARIRMSILFDKAADFNAVVMGTSNKSELLLGYSTWYGDMAASLYPIGDLYKTQVWSLAQFMGMPERIIKKTPSADLWPGQSDEKELGEKYKVLDEILYLYVDQRKTREEIIALGYNENAVNIVFERIYKTQYKRTFPPVAKFSPRTVGIDFLYPHDFKR